MIDEARALSRLKAPLELVETAPELILPIGATGYALNASEEVCGLKASFHGVEAADLTVLIQTIFQLSNLEALVLYSWNLPAQIPESISNLKKLRFLWLGGSFRSLPPQILELDLPIYLLGHERSRDPAVDAFMSAKETLEGLLHTTYREMSETEDSRLGPSGRGEKAMIARLRADPALSSQLPVIRGIFLELEQLEDPPLEIVAKGRQALATYFRERADLELPLNEVKVILVGDGGSGKTSLVKRLLGERFDPNEPQTHGINIRSWHPKTKSSEPVKAHIWDFGGQEIMHATHQFFLSKRSVYVVVLDGRKEEDTEYWLQLVESFGGDSPALIVMNKIDQNPSYDVNRKFIQSKYAGVSGFFRLSCAKGTGVSAFKAGLEKAFRRTPILRTRWPSSWFRVKERLDNLRGPYISMREFVDICSRERVADAASQKTLVDFLHDLGIVVHFRDFRLLDTHVLDPRWVTEGVYAIINSDVLARKKGVLALEDLGNILKPISGRVFEYPVEKHMYLVELMIKFELCYRLEENVVLIPDLLSVQEPDLDFDADNATRFVFQYSYLPKSIMPRFLVRMNKDIFGDKRWRSGVMLKSQVFAAEGLVRADEQAKSIDVFVTGPQRRDYFSVIRAAFNEIHSSFEKLGVTELVPLPDRPDVMLEYRELIGYEISGRKEIFVGRLGREYNVGTLLNGLVEESERRQESVHTIINVAGDYFGGRKPVGARRSLVEEEVGSDDGGRETRYRTTSWEKGVVYSVGVLVTVLVGFLLVRNEPIADPNLVVLVRTLLSLMVAVFGAVIPGMLRVDFSRKGLAIRAMGALALFVLSFVVSPSVLSHGPG